MIKRYSNDKSSVRVMASNYSFLCNKNTAEKIYIDKPFSEYLHHFSKWCEEAKGITVRRFTYKRKFELDFPYFSASIIRKAPFSIIISFNYIQYLNESGFNYIQYCSEFDDLKPFVTSCINHVISLLTEFYSDFCSKYDQVTDFNGILLKDKFVRKSLTYFNKHYISVLRKERVVDLCAFSVTLDIKFNNPEEKSIFFNSISTFSQPYYKGYRIDDETLYFFPYNKTLESAIKDLPVVRFYDKQKNLLYEYFKQRKIFYRKDKALKKLRNHQFSHIPVENDFMTFIENDTQLEVFEAVTIASHKQDYAKFEADFVKSYNFLDNVLRFEIDFKSIRAIRFMFKTSSFYDLHVDNETLINDYLYSFINQENVSYTEILFKDQLKQFDTEKFKYINHLTNICEDITDMSLLRHYMSVTIKNQKLFNSILSYRSMPTHALNCSKTAFSMRISRLRQKGVVSGRGSNISLNQPYSHLLSLLNLYTICKPICTQLLEHRSQKQSCKGHDAYKGHVANHGRMR